MDTLSEQPCVTLTFDDPVLRQCYRLRVPGMTPEDGYAFLEHLDSDLMQRSMASSNPARASWSRGDHLRHVASTVGKTNANVNSGVYRSARYLKAGGAIVMVAGMGLTYREYQKTPEPLKAEFLRREAVAAAGGAFASGLATAFLVTTSAAGIVVVGVGLVAGVAGALAAEGIYRSIYGDSLIGQLQASGVIQANLLGKR
jgi:hypothetical protein